jgi:hypothetical protein
MDNVVYADFKNTPKKASILEIKQKLLYTLDKELLNLEEFEDYNRFLCALALLIADTSVACAYDTSKLPNATVYCEGLKKVLLKRYEDEGF